MNRSFRFVALPSEQFVPLFDLSIRAYDADAMMVDAEVTKGSELEDTVGRLLADERVRYLHIHNAIPGCYNCRVVRA